MSTLSFFFDVPKTRILLTQFANEQESTPTIRNKQGEERWGGALPQRAGEYFYGEPWIIYAAGIDSFPLINLSAFDASTFKKASTVAAVLAELSSLSGWAIFPWGGYAKYGMLALISDSALPKELSACSVFTYSTPNRFEQQYRGLIARRTHGQLAGVLWDAFNGEASPVRIISFEYYEGALSEPGISTVVESSLIDSDGVTRLSVYRVSDLSSFVQFIGIANQVSTLDILPGDLSLDDCLRARTKALDFNFSGALQHAPWLMLYNGGEIDTNHLLFTSSEHQVSARFVEKTAGPLEIASFF